LRDITLIPPLFAVVLRSGIAPLDPLGDLAYRDLCDAIQGPIWGIEPHFDLWNHFFHIRLLQGSGVKVIVLGGVDIYVKSRFGVNPYFHLPMFESTDRQ
jgi:hypothetical protein